MARKQKYTEDDLLTAVVKYGEIYKGKIEASELAKWADEHIPALKGVKYYHFTRDIRILDQKTQKMVLKKKACKERIDELNEMRSASSRMHRNTLIYSTNPDEFFELPYSKQRELILDMRDIVQKTESNNFILQKEANGERIKNTQLVQKFEEFGDRIDQLTSNMSILQQHFEYIVKEIGIENAYKAIECAGIKEKRESILMYHQNVTQCASDLHHLYNDYQKYKQEINTIHDEIQSIENDFEHTVSQDKNNSEELDMDSMIDDMFNFADMDEEG